jgi:hypothetical protein
MKTALLVLLAAAGGYLAALATPSAEASPGFTALFMFSVAADAPDDAIMDELFVGELASPSLCDSIARALTEHARERPSDKVGTFGCKREVR